MGLFIVIAVVLALAVFGMVLRPLWRAKQRSATLLIVGLTLASAGLYRHVGNPVALDASMVERPQTVEQALMQLERSRTRYKIVEETVQPDDSILIKIKKQYNHHDCGDYMD